MVVGVVLPMVLPDEVGVVVGWWELEQQLQVQQEQLQVEEEVVLVQLLQEQEQLQLEPRLV